MDLWESISTLAGTRNQTNVICFYGTVTSVDIPNRKCSISTLTLNATESNFDVDLCILGNTGLIIVPSVDSQVLVMYSKNVNPIVIQHSFVDKILLNGDENGGLPITSDVVTRLNNIENLVNDLITKYNLHTHPYLNIAVPSSTSPTASLETSTLTPTQDSDIASTTIFQG